MKPNTGKAERMIRSGLGLLVTAIGAYTLFVNLWVGVFIVAVGVFTIGEGITGWTFLRAFWGTSSAPGSTEVPEVAYSLLWDTTGRSDDK
jgi:hypothetical protein